MVAAWRCAKCGARTPFAQFYEGWNLCPECIVAFEEARDIEPMSIAEFLEPELFQGEA